MIVTFSIYNIYVKPVQDYLLPIPRTYIFYQKIVAGLSIYDFFLYWALWDAFNSLFYS